MSISSKFVLYVLDTETTTLDHQNGDIIELSIIRLNDDTQKTWTIKPENVQAISAEALRVNGHKLEDITHQTAVGKSTYRSRDKVIIEIENWIMEDNASSSDRVLCGQNPFFDLQFLQKLWESCDTTDTFPFGKRPFLIDTRQLDLILDIAQDKRSDYYNLASLVKKYGVKSEKAHKADADTRMTKEVLVNQLQLLSKALKNNA